MPIRVVQWATGAMGAATLRGLLDSDEVEVVGAFVYNPAKAGRDVAELVRRAPIGVAATSDVDEILALDADVVVHAGRLAEYGSHDDDIARLLEAGKNVVSINGYSRPQHWTGPRLERLEQACRSGGASLIGAGLNPGFAAEQLAAAATAVCLRVDRIEVVEHVDSSPVQQAAYLFDTLGFGQDASTVDPNAVGDDGSTWGPAGALNGMYEEVLAALAHNIGTVVTGVTTRHVVHAASRDVQLRTGVVQAGGISHTNWRWEATTEAGVDLAMSIHWYVDTEHLEQPDPPLWRITVTGHPGITLAVELEKHPDDTTRMSAEQYALAAQVLRAVRYAVDAPPGVISRPIVTPYDARSSKEH
ncbi:MAG: hypothetical protein ACTHMS_06945 [Jatrophihabitans sp.]|uniref:hypothetical protein n=1 Tax=Jatrophihabitans sp. TaxID=1932789 RepID=UPI003F7ED6B0